MCGISGIIGPEANSSILQILLKGIAHRGEEEFFAETEVSHGFAVGTNRLAIVDSEHGKQPFKSRDGKVICICNGEIYNYREINSKLTSYGFVSACDTETILAGYLSKGVGIFDDIQGMYAILIYDMSNNTWLLTRDHLGIKPLYYAWDGNKNFYFSSELKSFSLLKQIKNIKELLPGEVIKNGELLRQRKQYAFNNLSDNQDDRTALETGRRLLGQAVAKMFPPPNEKVACLLSGGVDSSTVLYLTKMLYDGLVEAYTFYNKAADNSDDYNSAKLLCQTLNIDLKVVSPSIEELTDFYLEQGVWMTETFECPLVRNAVSYHFLCKAIKENGYKFALSGEGADEILGGYGYFSLIPIEKRDLAICSSLNEIYRTYLQMADRASMFATLEIRVPYMDECFTDYVCSLGPEYRIRSDVNKWLIREMLPGLIPDKIRFRPKVGMNQGAGYGSNDPGQSIYYQSVVAYYNKNEEQKNKDLKLTLELGPSFGLEDPDIEETYNFCQFIKHGFGRFNNNGIRPQLNTTKLNHPT